MVLLVDVQRKKATGSDDLASARALIERAEHADGRPPVSDQALIAAAQGKRELALFHEGSGLVGAGIIGEGELDLVVDPAARGRGVGSAALDALLDERALRAWSHGDNPAADALLSKAGFEPVRTLLRMELDPALLPQPSDPLEVAVPDGYALRGFDPSDPADSAAWVRVNAAAFADHPEQGRITEADFGAIREEPWFDADDLILLEGADGLAGSTWIKTEGDRTELYAIGVDPAHAGKGLGKALLAATLARMAQQARSGVSLYVEGDNAPALALYEAAGFTVASTSRQWSNARVH